MRQTVTLSLPSWILKKLRQVTNEDEVSRSEVVRNALQQYLTIREFRKLRKQAMRQAGQLGIYTDEEVFRKVS